MSINLRKLNKKNLGSCLKDCLLLTLYSFGPFLLCFIICYWGKFYSSFNETIANVFPPVVFYTYSLGSIPAIIYSLSSKSNGVNYRVPGYEWFRIISNSIYIICLAVFFIDQFFIKRKIWEIKQFPGSYFTISLVCLFVIFILRVFSQYHSSEIIDVKYRDTRVKDQDKLDNDFLSIINAK